ncbi:tungstate ABC transporter permease [Chthoniobacter flavus Ellin428]|uniref:Tungstate ABC transporter permease n=1 Tax=Chthoniobacter flavus Ellin428 TaxID=497964 RepID=B4CUE4_9BACT|nr:substrate-binding domain-containing protein [Chthoniobacter flavus]EDY22182.1 tungstate ABC transporter permease [Chthoniobacter flavus Ellin428]TCO94789.1 tungstate transport system substrate-binding protein [Chthoniobacter flavus]
MIASRRAFLGSVLLTSAASIWTPLLFAEERPPIRVAAIGGMTMTGMWQELATKFEADTGWKTLLVITGPKDVLSAPFKRGEIDLLTMHSADKTTDLVADGYGVNLRPWARNEHTIVGPPSDPAGIRGMKDGAAALKKIAAAHAPFVDFYGPGSREITHKLWQRAGLKPEGDWLLKDESDLPENIVAFAEKKQAYVVVGRLPITYGKMALGKMEVLVQGDPEMRRTYVVVEVNPQKFPQANAAGARVLADWLTGDPGQKFLLDYGRKAPGGIPLYHPIHVPGEEEGVKGISNQ